MVLCIVLLLEVPHHHSFQGEIPLGFMKHLSHPSHEKGVLGSLCPGFEELCRCMEKMNAELGIENFTERHVEHYMHRFDTDGDKFLNQDECLGG